ncbi:MAG: hypothetical protein IKY92_01620 [Akkermansia sp.]|nr:hypothetical protein [Akkermansia sp.]
MKSFYLLLACAAVVAFMPVQAQGRRGRAARPSSNPAAASTTTGAAAEAAEPKSGVRFVVCSPSGENMPSPLYVRSGKEFKAIHIGARSASNRVKPVGGVVEFWKENPMPTAGMDDNKKTPSADKKLPEPIFKVTVPSTASSKTICILTPSKEIEKTSTLFLNEGDFPRKGMHIINLSSFPLQITTSDKGDFSDKKESKVGVYRREDGICANNSWSFKGEKGQQVSFVLTYTEKGAKSPKRIKASTFVISGQQAVINVVVKDPKLNRPRIMTIQMSED